MPDMTATIVALGLIAGAMTTIAGAGGGVFLIVTLSLLIGPHATLATTAPTLLVGNVHRVLLYRKRVVWRTALPVIAGAVPGSLAGGVLAMSLPQGVLRVVFVAVAAYSIARALDLAAVVPARALLGPAGAVVGLLSAMGAGAGLLLCPIMMAMGLTGEAYVATSAAVAMTTHAGRLSGYFARGFVTHEIWSYAAVAAVSVVAGNLVGDRLRPLLDGPRRTAMVERGALAVCAILAVAGLR